MTSTLELLDSLTPALRDSSASVRVAVVDDTRSPLLEFRVAVSAAGTPSPDGRALAAILVGHARWTEFTEAVADSGGNCAVEDQGEWAVVHGHVLPWDGEWLDALTGVLDGLGEQLVQHSAALAALPIGDPAQAAWDAAHAVALSPETPRAVAVLIGTADDATVGALTASLDRFTADPVDTGAVSRPARATAAHDDDDEIALWLGGVEPAGDLHGAARFLGTGLLTSAPTSKLIRGLATAPGEAERIMVGRDVRSGTPRVFGLAQLPHRDIAGFVDWVRTTVADGAAWEVDQAAFDALAEYCVANIAEAFESPRTLCEAAADGLMRGAPASWLADLTRGIPAVTLDEAQTAADSIFARLGDVVAVHRAAPAA